MKRIAFTAREKAELIDTEDFAGPLPSDELRGRSLVTLVSPGTELNGGFLGDHFPCHPGYAGVFEVEEIGSGIDDVQAGDLVFCSGNHAARQKARRCDVIKLPPGLAPETAVFARLAGVSMSSLNATVVRPPATVLVTGLGPVGLLAAQVFSAAGYAVIAADPVEARRQAAGGLGIGVVRGVVNPDELRDHIDLHIECSGHEQAVLDGSRCVRKGGEIFLVGVAWRKKTEIPAFDLLREIFHRLVSIRSGWEWQTPVQPREFSLNSIMANLQAALGWLEDGRLRVQGLAGLHAPEEAQRVYSGLLDQSLPAPAAIFDWR